MNGSRSLAPPRALALLAAVGLALWLLLSCTAWALDAPELSVDEPRAFGHSVGDVVKRRITIRVPKSLHLDEASLPQTRRGTALELRRVRWERHAERGAERYELRLDYQIFLAPRDVRLLEMPPLMLRFDGQPRAQELRVDAWPVVVAPLGPIDASPRHGLGELRPDRPPPLIDTHASRLRLALYAAVALVGLGYLAWVYAAWPWWQRRHRPFGRAWHDVRGLSPGASPAQTRAAIQRLHEALNRTAGQVLFEQGIDGFVAARPRFAPLRGELTAFFGRSREAFFALDGAAPRDPAWLIEFCRRCRNVERGAA
jgi:mxaA protein